MYNLKIPKKQMPVNIGKQKNRNFDGEIMTQRDIKLAKQNLYSKGTYMKPILVSSSVKIRKG